METRAGGMPSVPPFYQRYLDRVGTNEPLTAMRAAGQDMRRLVMPLAAEMGGHRYASGKWSIAEVLQHVIDSERVFAYRAMAMARRDDTPLPGFEEDAWVAACDADRRPLDELLVEHDTVRASSILLFQSFSPAMLERTGTANAQTFSVRGIGLIIAGHALHHIHILRTRYIGHGST
jgi:hypothetical protein